jgi:hypothetical protein
MKKYMLAPVAFFFLLLFAACRPDVDMTDAGGTGDTARSAAAVNAPADAVVTTVAQIIERANGDMEYTFNERQAGYVVTRNNPAYGDILKLAREALAGRKPVKLYSQTPGSLDRLSWPGTTETAAYLEWYKSNILDAEINRKVNMAQIDTSTFNYVDVQDWKVFLRCTSTVPDFATAKKIFDYCKQQTCTVGPTQEQPCIPFGYARDGCFARAHKMRKIISEKFKYCSEKVFSFGYGTTLWVKATLGGGCCVNWWYHVAPLLRVKGKYGLEFCYVIDPSMFTKPVLLSTWLDAQDDTTCNASASLSSYSIQPGTAYTPVWGNPVTSYTTDPGYTLTNNSLQYYATQGSTCGN